MRTEVHWSYAEAGEEAFGFTRVLYAYLHPKSAEILYLGKADYCTVSERTRGAHKEAIFDSIAMKEKTGVLHPIVGVLRVQEGIRFSSELLSDIESLLIVEVQPRYNRQSKRTRIERPGLEVKCQGAWPLRRKVFRDV